MPDKACTKCQTVKPLAQFYFEKSRGRHKTVCKACYPRAKTRPTPEQRATYRRRRDPSMSEYRTREQIRADAEATRQAKAEAAAARAAMPKKPARGSREWYAAASQDEIETYRATKRMEFREYYARHTDKERMKTRVYKQRCKHVVAKWARDRWRRLSQSCDGTLTPDAVKILIQNERFCAYCMKEMATYEKTTDHVEPLSAGGKHSIDNVVVCCRDCNTRKGSKVFLHWLAEIDHGRRDTVSGTLGPPWAPSKRGDFASAFCP